MQFPTLTTNDLNGKSVTFPDDFAHGHNLLFVAYDQWQQREVDSWLPFAAQLETDLDLRYYELPVVGRMNAFGRMQLDFWMRRGIPDVDIRSRTLTYYVDRAQFRQALGIETDAHIAIVLVNRQGRVLWKTYGAYSAESAASLKDFLTPEATPNLI